MNTKNNPNQSSKNVGLDNASPGIHLDQINELIAQSKKEILEEARNDIIKLIEMDKISYIAIFGIFSSILFFLSTEIQFLKTMNNPLQIAGFSLVLLASLLFFNLSLNFIAKNKKWTGLFIIFFILLFFITGIYLLCIT